MHILTGNQQGKVTALSNSFASINLDGTISDWTGTTLGSTPTNNWSAPVNVLSDVNKDIWSHLDYNGGSPVPCYLFTYNTSVNTSYLGIQRPNTATGVNKTFYAFSDFTNAHVGCVSAGNKSYITDGNFVRAYSPNTGTVSNSINVGVGYVTTSVCDFGNYVAIVGSDGVNARMWLWDGSANNPNFQYEVRDTYVTKVINRGGILKVFSYGRNATTKIKTFNGNGFDESADWEILTAEMSSPVHGSVDIWNNMIIWKDNNNYIWTYGTPQANEIPSGVHKIGNLGSGIDTNLNGYGAFRNLFGSMIFAGYRQSGNTYLTRFSNIYSSGSFNYTTKVYELPHKATIKCIHVYFDHTAIINDLSPNTLAVYAYLRNNQFNTGAGDYMLDFDALGLGTGIMPTGLKQGIQYFPIKKAIPDADMFYLSFTQNGSSPNATIRKIVVEYNYEEGDI